MKLTIIVLITVTASCFSALAKDGNTNSTMWQTEYEQKVSSGLYALNSKNYKDALPKLQEAAKLGSKEAQFYLAQLYFNGWGIEPDYQKGWLWLNVALEQKTREWKEAYRKIKKSLPKEFVTSMKPYVITHIDMYGAKAKNLRCEKRSQIGSNIKEVICTMRFAP